MYRKSAFFRCVLQLLIIGSIAAFLLSGCSSARSKNSLAEPTGNQITSPTEKIKIVTAENFLGEAAAVVGGDRVEVTSIINSPDADPHDFEPTADSAKAVNDAQVIVYVGIGYDEWMDKLLKAGPSTQKIINIGSGLLGKKSGDNPHIWYIPDSMAKLADALAVQLAQIDAGHADDFKKGAEQYKKSLAPLTELVNKLKQSPPADIAVSEPVFDYMAQALNLNIINTKFAKAAEEESDPAPKDIARLQDAIKGRTIKFFAENTQAESASVNMMVDLARANQVPVVHITETEPQGKSYVQWMHDQLLEVEQALGPK